MNQRDITKLEETTLFPLYIIITTFMIVIIITILYNFVILSPSAPQQPT